MSLKTIISKYYHFCLDSSQLEFKDKESLIIVKTPKNLVPFSKRSLVENLWNKKLFQDCQFAHLKFTADGFNKILIIKCINNSLIPEHLTLAYG